MKFIRLLACIAVGLGFTLGVGSVASATQNHDKPWICHPVEGNGETGYGWNLINPDEASKHIDEVTGEGKHTRKDGSTDVYADEAGHCPGYTPPPTETTTPTPSGTPSESWSPSPTVTSTPTPTKTETSTPTPTATDTSTPTPTDTSTPTPTDTSTPTPTETETSTPTPSETETTTPTPSDTPSDSPSPSDIPSPSDEPSQDVTPNQPTSLAQTGSDTSNLLVWAVGLIMAGGLALLATRKAVPHKH